MSWDCGQDLSQVHANSPDRCWLWTILPSANCEKVELRHTSAGGDATFALISPLQMTPSSFASGSSDTPAPPSQEKIRT